MKCIINLCESKYYNNKVAGLSILLRHMICLSKIGVDKIFLITNNDINIDIFKKDKRVKSEINICKNISEAISYINEPCFIISEDAVYSTEFLTNLSKSDINSKYDGIDFFYINETEKIKTINLISELKSDINPMALPENIFFRKIKDKSAIKRVEKYMVKALRTSGDTLISRYMNRYISLWVTSKIMHFNITPNFITTINFLLGIGAVVCMWLIPDPIKQPLSGTLFNLSSILDGCDGEIARLKFQGSNFGAKYDDYSDEITNVLFFTNVAFYTIVYLKKDLLNTLFAIIGSSLFILGKLIHFWLNSKQKIVNVKYQQFYFENKTEKWGKNPIIWIFKLGRYMVRNDFLALLVMTAGFLQAFFIAPYIVIVFGTGFFIAIFIETINFLKTRNKQEVKSA